MIENVFYYDLTDNQRKLLSEAEKVMENAYNPYSNFYVGAALLSNKGEIIVGTNLENAAYGSTICAERAAIASANSRGIRSFNKLAIIARGNGVDTTDITAPCGACRQVIFEFSQVSGIDTEIIMFTTKKDKITIATISEILALGFGPKDLGIDVQRFR